MKKRVINLIIKKEKDSLLIRRLNFFLPITAVLSLIIFTIAFFASFYYIKVNSSRFNIIKAKINAFEQKISSQKSVEGIYTLSASRVRIIEPIFSKSKNFTSIISEINKLPTEGVIITNSSFDKNGNLSFSVEVSSVEALENFIYKLVGYEEKKTFSNIKANGIIRDKNGNYILSISAKVDSSLLR